MPYEDTRFETLRETIADAVDETAQTKAIEFGKALKRFTDTDAGLAFDRLLGSLTESFKERAISCETEERETWRGAILALDTLRMAIMEAIDYVKEMEEAGEDESLGFPAGEP